ncbi:MAG: TIGR04255 family protein [Candidatus Poribacteria bacterium]|nr:TIGR04255 family protein [Candidatus Poribacteria bacterium]
MEHHQYKNPPIEEALCEFRFEPDQEWGLTILGRLLVELSKEYSGKPQQQKVMDVSVNAQQGQRTKLSYSEELEKVQLVTQDGKRIVAVGQDVLSIHMLRPYQDPQRPEHSGWDEFQQRIEEALAVYWEEVQPKGVLRVGIRYINKIVIPEKGVKAGNYLKSALPVVDGLPDHANNFLSRVDYVYDDGMRLVLSQRSLNTPLNQVEFLLDLDVIWEDTEPVGKDEALAKANYLRDREREAFEAVITDKARELFNADGN